MHALNIEPNGNGNGKVLLCWLDIISIWNVKGCLPLCLFPMPVRIVRIEQALQRILRNCLKLKIGIRYEVWKSLDLSYRTRDFYSIRTSPLIWLWTGYGTRGYQNVYQLDQSLPLRLLTRPASIDAIVGNQLFGSCLKIIWKIDSGHSWHVCSNAVILF